MTEEQSKLTPQPNAELWSVLSGPDDPIWEDIFDWVAYLVQPFSSIVASSIRLMSGAVQQSLGTFIQQSVAPMSVGLNMVGVKLDQISTETSFNKALLKGLPSEVHDQVLTASMIAGADIIRQMYYNQSVYQNRLMESTYYLEQSLARQLGYNMTTFQSAFSAYASHNDAIQESYLRAITLGNRDMAAHLAATHADIIDSVDRLEIDVIGWLQENIVDPIGGWFSSFLDRLFDFGSWIGGFLEVAWNWINRDIPGHSPWWETVLNEIGKAIYGIFIQAPLDIIEFLVKSFNFGLTQVLAPIGEVFNEIVTLFLDAVEGLVGNLGPTNPDMAGSVSKSLTSVGMTAIVGLAGMTLASSWMKPLGGAGMGQIAAMIYDMTQFKVITGASVTALAVASIKTPLTYHFNNIFRPNLLPEALFLQLMSRKAFSNPLPLRNPALVSAVKQLGGTSTRAYESRYLGYQGYPPEYLGLFIELANTPLRYFPLAGIARTGFYDFEWFDEALQRSGYSKTAVEALHVMYQKMVDETLQGSFSGAAVTRFKEGFTNEAGFKAEMTMLGYSDEQFTKYLVAAQMDYATDYMRDMISAYRDAVRKGNISLDEYRNRLSELGIVAQRVEAYVIREKVRFRPGEEPWAKEGPTPLYDTDWGKIEVDTIRRRRRKNLITAGDQTMELGKLGMPSSLIGAIVANDNVRLAEKGGED
jgi:hypothetical protein